MTVTIHEGDCLAQLAALPDNSVDSIVTDPPYGLSQLKPVIIAAAVARWANGDREYTPPAKGGFMGKTWDSFVPPPAVWDECLRVLKPGGHMLVFAGTRTQDLMGLSIRLAGFEIRDGIGWIYGSGFPKSMDVSKAIDKAAGAEREVTGQARGHVPTDGGNFDDDAYEWKPVYDRRDAPATPEAERWSGWGTSLKPAIEPVIVARKPIVGTVAANVLQHGTGALNIDASRVPASDSLYRESSVAKVVDTSERHEGWDRPYRHSQELVDKANEETRKKSEKADKLGRFPANVLLDPEAAAAMDEQSGVSTSRPSGGGNHRTKRNSMGGGAASVGMFSAPSSHSDSGGASRFFPVFKYQAKAPKKERPEVDGIKHPTVKPLALMEWLVTLITPPGGVVLDPFAGSGTTLEAAHAKGFHAIGVEAHPPYVELIRERLRRAGIDTDTDTDTADSK